jgi:hypothetical protein
LPDSAVVRNSPSRIGFEEIMQLPSVDNFVKDPTHGITYNICAYRKLSEEEMMRAVQVFNQQQGGYRPRQGGVVKIFSVIGLNDS